VAGLPDLPGTGRYNSSVCAKQSETIECAKHGTTKYCIICVHLRERSRLDYIAVAACKHGHAQAWCGSCDEARAREGGWSDASEGLADFNLLCRDCYVRILRRHNFVTYSQGPDETCDWSELEPPGA
jgi:hypothetical protein